MFIYNCYVCNTDSVFVVAAEQDREESCRCVVGCETGHVDACRHRRHEPRDTGGPHGGEVDDFIKLFENICNVL